MTLSACLIVKNEAQNLPRCLESVRDWADEIVVVDTGSTDDTVAIAESFGAKVHHFAWCDDFAAARNFALEHATGDWVLVIDADEELVVEQPDALAQALASDARAFSVPVANVGESGAIASQFAPLRLVRRAPGVAFAGRLHEDLTPAVVALGWPVVPLGGVRLRHYGYTNEALQQLDKRARNARLARLMAEEQPDDPNAWYQLARSMWLQGDRPGTHDALQRLAALETAGQRLDPIRERTYLLLCAWAHGADGDLARALDALDRGLARYPNYPEFLFERGRLHVEAQQLDAALADFEACLQAPREGWESTVRAGVTGYLAHVEIVALHARRERLDLVRPHLLAASRDPACPPAEAVRLGQLALALPMPEPGPGAPTLSACLIVKDEAENLPRSLESVRNWVDEIIVVDTGSTDDTVAIAESFGAKVHHFAWCDDFSAARNVSLDHATSDWVLVIDADEQLLVDDPEAFREARSTPQALVLRIESVGESGAVEFQSPAVRLFPRDARLRYQGRVHETLVAALQEAGLALVELSAARIHHAGYRKTALAERGKAERNVRLAQREVQDHPLDGVAHLNLARSLALAGRLAEALAAYGAVAVMPGGAAGLGDNLWLHYVLGLQETQQALGDAAGAETTLNTALAKQPGHPELLFERGRLYAKQQHFEAARTDLEACLAPGAGAHTLVRPGITDALPRQVLALLPAPARPENPEVRRLLGELEQSPWSAGGFLELAFLFYQETNLDKALVAIAQALELNANVAAGYHLFGLLLDKLGQPEYAEKAFQTALMLDPEHPNALQCRLACRRKQAEYELTPEQTALFDRLLGRAYPSVSACLIVKDEAKNLPRCLEAVRNWVDEIVVVDTGSSDDTVAIAESYGARVHHFAWCDDFSAARNHSLGLATSDWVLVVDADEELVVDDPEAFRQALRHGAVRGYYLRQGNVGDDGVSILDAPVVRLFQRDPAIRFRGRLHEAVEHAIREQGWLLDTLDALWLRHEGYVSTTVTERGKPARNVALARLQVAEAPEDPAAWLDLARSLTFDNRFEEALTAYARVEALFPKAPAVEAEKWFIHLTGLFELYVALDRPLDAERVLDRALARLPGHPGLGFERGKLRYNRGDVAGAIADFEACLSARAYPPGAMMLRGATDALPREALAKIAALHPEQFQRATAPTLSWGQIADAQAAENPDAWLAQARAHAAAGRTDEALAAFARLDALLDGAGTPEALWFARTMALSNLYIAAKRPNDAERTLDAALARTPDEPAFLLQRARLRYQRGAARQAIADLRACLWSCEGDASLNSVATEARELFARAAVEYTELFREEAPDRKAQLLARLAEQPHQAKDFLELAHLFYQETNLDKALVAIAQSLELNANVAAAYHLFGLLLDKLGQPAYAEKAFQNALMLDPEHPNALQCRLACRRKQAEYELTPEQTALFDRLLGRAYPSVSACLIVKDEAENLPRCLEAMRDWVDEIIVVDTGSTDDTVAIAESYGARVHRHAGADALTARHRAIEHASSDWLLFLDAGETLAVVDGDAFRGALRNRTPRGYTIRTGEGDNAELRLFQRLDALKGDVRDLAAAIAAQGWPVANCTSIRLPRAAGAVRVEARRTVPQRPAAPSVSACLIVKDEAQNLPRCLESVRDWVDEIIVVDTGSSDDTVAIAAAHGAKVHHFTWCDDFSAARNHSLELATGDWLLVLDADEQLIVEDAEAFRQALAQREEAAYFVRVGSVHDGAIYDTPLVRLFRRDPRVRFHGRLHEQVEDALREHGMAIGALSALWLRHEGYSPEMMAAREKGPRNLRIAERDVAERPHAPDAWLALARSLSASGRLEEAFAAFERLDDLLARTGDPGELWFLRTVSLSELCIQAQRPADAERALDQGLARMPDAPVLRYMRARLRLQRADWRGAFVDLQTCLLACDAQELSARPRELAAQAQALLAQATAQAPELAAMPFDRKAMLLARLEEQPRDAEGFLELAFLFYQEESWDKALLAIAQSLELNSGISAGYHLFGLILDKLGQPGYAGKAFQACLQLEPDHPMALKCQLSCRHKTPEYELTPEQAMHFERLLSRLQPTVSVCMIVKNEAQDLPRCLESVRDWADEIVVVDTGSTDDTVAIAESFGARVYPFAWCDDFSAARNHSLEHATGDWVLVLDADETLVVEDAEAFRRALRDRTRGGYISEQRNLTNEGQQLKNPVLRLFQRHPGIRFAKRLHEHVGASIEALGWQVASLPAIALAHDGYLSDKAREKGKWERNLRIAAADAEANPESPDAWYNLGRSSLLGQVRRDDAIAAFAQVERLLEAGGTLAESSFINYVTLYQRLLREDGAADAAEALLDRAIARYPGHPELHFERGALRAARGEAALARQDYQTCLNPNLYLSALRDGITDELPRRALAELDARVASKGA